MLTTSHALVGGVILKTIPDPRISLPLAFFSHFVLDFIPHWDFITNLTRRGNPPTLAGNKERTRVAILAAGDVFLSFSLTLWLFRDLNLPLLALTIFLTQLPDWMEMPYFFWGIKLAPSIWVKRLQSRMHSRLTLPWGLVTQIAILAPILWWTLT